MTDSALMVGGPTAAAQFTVMLRSFWKQLLASVDCSAVMHDGGATAGQGAVVDQISHATVA